MWVDVRVFVEKKIDNEWVLITKVNQPTLYGSGRTVYDMMKKAPNKRVSEVELSKGTRHFIEDDNSYGEDSDMHNRVFTGQDWYNFHDKNDNTHDNYHMASCDWFADDIDLYGVEDWSEYRFILEYY